MMTDEEIERVVQSMVPELRLAIRGLLSGEMVHTFDAAAGVNSSTGVRSKLVCLLAHEFPAIVLEQTAAGLVRAAEFKQKQTEDLLRSHREMLEKASKVTQ